ncbi:MAG: hypothetical protein BWZ02_03097 [Lentisphaerae bacterium ADurb.BinA184]|nr:MAG: hypothetical protein BWZ02_03097 [Lentisphaerae bacterium ADurb.BinA184]
MQAVAVGALKRGGDPVGLAFEVLEVGAQLAGQPQGVLALQVGDDVLDKVAHLESRAVRQRHQDVQLEEPFEGARLAAENGQLAQGGGPQRALTAALVDGLDERPLVHEEAQEGAGFDSGHGRSR